MFAIVINEKGGQPRRQEFQKSEVTIGRVQGNDIILPKQNVSKRHSRIVVKDGKFIIVDLKSTNGTYVNGRKIASPMVIKSSDKIYIGDFIMSVDALDGASAMSGGDVGLPSPMPDSRPTPMPAAPPPPAPKAPPPPPPRKPPPIAPLPAPSYAAPVAAPHPPAPVAAPPPAPRPAPIPAPIAAPVPARPASPTPIAAPIARPVQRPTTVAAPASRGLGAASIYDRLSEHLQAAGLSPASSWSPMAEHDEVLWERVEAAARETLHEFEGRSGDLDAAMLAAETLAAGPLTALLSDATVRRIFVNGPDHLQVVRSGAAEDVAGHFSSGQQLVNCAHRMLRAAGSGIANGAHFAEGFFSDGTRLHLALSTVGGPFLTIDRPAGPSASLEALVSRGTLSQQIARFLELAMRVGTSVIVSSNCVDARFEFIGALVGSSRGLRTVVVEGGGRVLSRNAVTLVGAPGADNGALIAHALKMRPDRLVVADCRGPEAFAALSALSGGVNGGIIGVEATSVDDAAARLVRLAALATAQADRVDALIQESPRVLVQLHRHANGSVVVAQVAELAAGQINDIYTSDMRPTGNTPAFVTQAHSLGHAVDSSLFR